MTRARARELNYQVNSFLPVPKPSSQNWMLLNHCDDFIVIRNDGEEANGSTNQFGHQDCTTRKHKNRTPSLDFKFVQPGNIKLIWQYFSTPDVVWGIWVLIGKILKSTFKWIQAHCKIPPEMFSMDQKTFRPLVLGWQPCNLFGPLRTHIVLGFPPPHASWLSPIYK